MQISPRSFASRSHPRCRWSDASAQAEWERIPRTRNALKRLVAIKMLSSELARDPLARGRFEREAEAVAAIAHPNVVAVYAVGELASGVPYFVMQYVSGRSAADACTTTARSMRTPPSGSSVKSNGPRCRAPARDHSP